MEVNMALAYIICILYTILYKLYTLYMYDIYNNIQICMSYICKLYNFFNKSVFLYFVLKEKIPER